MIRHLHYLSNEKIPCYPNSNGTVFWYEVNLSNCWTKNDIYIGDTNKNLSTNDSVGELPNEESTYARNDKS